MGKRKDKAIELHKNFYTCSQSVACAFCDLINVEPDIMKTAVLKYSGGAYNVCGAIMGAYVIANCLKRNVNFENTDDFISENDPLLNEIKERFRAKNSSINCKDLKGLNGGPMLRSCRGCVEDAAEILEELLNENLI